MTNSDEIIQSRIKWYNFIPTLLELVKCLQNKELSIIDTINRKKNIRYILALNIDYLQKHFKAFSVIKNNCNLYHSCSYLKEIPIFTYNLKKRNKETEYTNFNNNYDKHIIGFDLFFDFDGKENFKKCYDEAKEFKKILEDKKVPYYLLNSSSKGFHFIIPNEYIQPEKDIYKKLETFKNVIFNLIIIYDFKNLDDTIIDIKRLKKVPYSFVSDKTIALPLTDKQFENFTPESVSPEFILKNIKIKNRGLLTRDYNLPQETLKKNVKEFINNLQE